MALNLSSYKSLYVQTARELIDLYEKSYLALHDNKLDTQSIHDLYRSMHSLKGQSLFMNYREVGMLSALLETLFFPFTSNPSLLTKEILSALPAPAKFMSNIDSIEINDTEIQFDHEIGKIQTLIQQFSLLQKAL